MDRPRTIAPNAAGLTKAEYGGTASTLCVGCGHNSIASQIVQVAFDLALEPHQVLKLSGIGCSSKSPAYFLGMSHGFNALHGRMPAVATGALAANRTLYAIGVSGDGDTGSIGMGQFKHFLRRNARMVYIVENNGVYGLTKGQFSATADEGLDLKYAGHNDLPAIDLCLEAIASGCGFVARSFAGDAKQVRELLKAALSHRGTAFLDIISPCVAFNNDDISPKSYAYGRDNQRALQELGWIPIAEEIVIDESEPGALSVVELHDGSHLKLRRVEQEFDPTDRAGAVARLMRAAEAQEFITGLVYYDPSRPSFAEAALLPSEPLASLPDERLRPPPEALAGVLHRYR